jgi:hypothetical protein
MKSAQNAVIPTIYLRNGGAKALSVHYMALKRLQSNDVNNEKKEEPHDDDKS